MTVSGISLVDANIWLAIAVDGHSHHAAAASWFDGQGEGTCAFCRITQLALLRHLTNPKANRKPARRIWNSLATSWKLSSCLERFSLHGCRSSKLNPNQLRETS